MKHRSLRFLSPMLLVIAIGAMLSPAFSESIGDGVTIVLPDTSLGNPPEQIYLGINNSDEGVDLVFDVDVNKSRDTAFYVWVYDTSGGFKLWEISSETYHTLTIPPGHKVYLSDDMDMTHVNDDCQDVTVTVTLG